MTPPDFLSLGIPPANSPPAICPDAIPAGAPDGALPVCPGPLFADAGLLLVMGALRSFVTVFFSRVPFSMDFKRSDVPGILGGGGPAVFAAMKAGGGGGGGILTIQRENVKYKESAKIGRRRSEKNNLKNFCFCGHHNFYKYSYIVIQSSNQRHLYQRFT